MTNTPLLYNIKRPPAARVSGLTRAAAFIVPALDAAPPAVPGYLASVNAWIHPDPAARRSVARGPSRYSGGIYSPAASAAAATNSPARLDDPGQPNDLNGSKAGERPERPERPERLKVTRTNDPNELNGLNDLKQAHRYPGGVFKPERLERLN